MRRPIERGWLTQGPEVEAFEASFAAYLGVKHAVAVSSATTGLHLALLALGITAGDEVVVPAFTWVASANAVVFCGATPVFVDVDPATFNLDPRDLARRIGPRTRAVIPVHLFGLCADLGAIRAIVPAGTLIVEDAACAAGARWDGRPAGTLGHAGVFSFHPRKSVTTGEGGMITTDDPEVARRARSLRNHGAVAPDATGPSPPHAMADHDAVGFNYRMTDLQAAIGRVQLGKLDRFIDERRAGVEHYQRRLGGCAWLRLPDIPPPPARHAWQSYVTRVDGRQAPLTRNALMEHLDRGGIGTRPGTHAVHMLGYYRTRFGLAPDDYPGALEAFRSSMAIPLHNRMTLEDYDYVADTILAVK